MLSNEQVQKIGELTEAKHNAAVALRAAQEKYGTIYQELNEYLLSLTEPVKPARKRRSDAGVRKLGLPSSEASISGLPDENGAGE